MAMTLVALAVGAPSVSFPLNEEECERWLLNNPQVHLPRTLCCALGLKSCGWASSVCAHALLVTRWVGMEGELGYHG